MGILLSVDCADPTCSGHGSCLHGQCHCIPGYTGSTCARREVDQVQTDNRYVDRYIDDN